MQDDDKAEATLALSNAERLLLHLPEDSLAAQLVKGALAPADEMKNVLAERLDQARQALGQAKN